MMSIGQPAHVAGKRLYLSRVQSERWNGIEERAICDAVLVVELLDRGLDIHGGGVSKRVIADARMARLFNIYEPRAGELV